MQGLNHQQNSGNKVPYVFDLDVDNLLLVLKQCDTVNVLHYEIKCRFSFECRMQRWRKAEILRLEQLHYFRFVFEMLPDFLL